MISSGELAVSGQEYAGEVKALEARDSFTRCLILDNLLEPIYEGIAIFAEQHVTPLNSDVASMPTILTALHFGMQRSSEMFSTLSEYITRSRRTINNIKRKTAILSYPGDPSNSPYLAGYMSALTCFYKVSSRFEVFRDPDFFLSYFKVFMFDDLLFAAILFRPGRSLVEFRDDVHLYVKERLTLFMTMDHSIWAARLQERILHPPTNIHELSSLSANRADLENTVFISDDLFTIAGDDCLDQIGRSILNDKISELYKFEQRTDSLMSVTCQTFAHLIATRTSIRLASRKVWVVNFENGVGLAETEAEFESLVARRGGSILPIKITTNVPDGPVVLECMAHEGIPYFVLRETESSGNILATFGHGHAAGWKLIHTINSELSAVLPC
jgi:hypothetical protein